jgi:CHAD domain-containing protein
MTTDRTAIRRRLAVRRIAHRPPSGARKAGHRSILAPLAATLAATVAASVFVGVGAALARAARDRRTARTRRTRQGKLGLRRDERLAAGLRRMALGQVDLAIEMLAGLGGGSGGKASDTKAVHETRKALKRLRALLRLLAADLGEQTFARENAVLRDVARRLSGARDAEVMLATLDALIERHPRKLARRNGLRKLRRRLVAEHERMERRTLGDPATVAQVLAELRAFRARADAWKLSDRGGIRLVQDDLRLLYEQGRRRRRRAARKKGRDVRAMHRWRKRVKDLRYAAEALDQPDLARRADSLGETLGEDHDLAVLAEWIRANAKRRSRSLRVARPTRKLLLKLIARRRRKLQRRALREGKGLYRQDPKKFVRRVRDAHR